MVDEKAIQVAQEKFGALVRRQLERVENLKAEEGPVDYSKLDKLIIGVCGGDGIGPYICASAQKVMEFLLADKIAAGKVVDYINLLFMDFAPAVATAVAAVAVIFVKLPLLAAGLVVLVVPLGILIVLRQIATQKGIRVERMETRAAMDGTTEKLIQKQIERFQAEYGITALSIAHRLSTLENSDEILVTDKGQIVQRGDFATLRDAPGIFQDMYRGILR